MLYREFPKAGVKVSAVSFGSMRWPSEEACYRIMQHGLDNGLNYVDTSTGYCARRSLKWTGRAVRNRRKEILFSCKSDWSTAPKADDVRRSIEASLKEAELEYFDFWQIWGVEKAQTVKDALVKGGFVEGIRKAQKDGLVRLGTGFTFHGPPDVFRMAVDSGEFACATVSYNLLNRAEEDQIAYAASKGVGIVIMNPLAGGVLGLAGDRNLEFLRGGGVGPAYGSLRFLLANRNITTGIVGFRAVEEVDEALAALHGARKLTEAYRQDLIARMNAVKLITGQFCTGCGYCKECPHGVNPTKFMQVMRDFVVYGVAQERLADWIWSKYAHEDIAAQLELCQECQTCEQKCPQHLKIIEAIRRARAVLGR
ncbi:MAG: aldo/keto reductase [Phycisphaerae bacterium]